MKRLLALLVLLPAFSGCTSLKLRECGLSTAVGAAGGGALGALFAADAVSGDSTSTGERAATGVAGAFLGAAAGNLYCQRAIRQRQDLEDRLRVVIAEEMAANAAEMEGGDSGTGGGGGETAESGGVEGGGVVIEAPPVEVIEGRGVRLELGDALLFTTGSAQLASAENPYLDAVAASLVDTPQSQIAVVGHTDDAGEADANLVLSERRAQAVVAYLESRGVATDRLKSVGKGETEPLVEGTTAAARAKNRRVEVYILPTS